MIGWLTAAAFAGSVFVNDVRVNPEDLHGVELKNVTVRADAEGNLHIDAPGYTVRPVNTTPTRPPVPAAAAPPVPVKPTSVVPVGTWWLYIEDDNSAGHLVDVTINGVLVTTVKSGQSAPLKDLARWLRFGPNVVNVSARSSNASGGPLYVYIGRGNDNDGTVNIGKPAVQFGVGQSRTGLTTRDYTLEVN